MNRTSRVPPLLAAIAAASLAATALGWPDPSVEAEAPAGQRQGRHPVVVEGLPSGAPRVATDRTDASGQQVWVACSTCHSARTPDRTRRSLQVFHRGLTLDHGQLSCLACHGGDDYDALRLADGTPLPYPQVMELCGQCHGPQRRDYDHGSHGGMQGYWDLTRGGRTRNACTVCHDPHAPAYPVVKPVFAPKDGQDG